MNKKVVLVTGASSGIGEETVKLLLNNQFIVYAAARRINRMEGLKQLGANILALDVTQDDSMKACVAQIIENEGRIDILINNAGYGSYGSIEDVPAQEGRRQFEVNVFGLAQMCQLVLPHMRQQNSGKIVNISSIGGKIHIPLGGWYHSTKYAVEGLSDCLRCEVKEFGIDVIIIQPGIIKTEWADITIENLRKTSLNGAYQSQTKLQIKSMNEAYSNSTNYSEPIVIAKTILKSILAKKPRTRYAVGKLSYLVKLRRFVSDRCFDKIINLNLKKYSR